MTEQKIIETLKLALKALEGCYDVTEWPASGRTLQDKAITALRTAIEAAEKQEPVAWLSTDSIGERYLCFDRPLDSDLVQSLYTTPPAAQRQPLTDEQIDDIWNRYCDEMGEASINDAYDIARAIEAAHGIKEKNT